MRYSLPVLMVVLVVTATVTVGTPALSPGTSSPVVDRGAVDAVAPIADAQNASNYLTLPDSGAERSQFGNATLDFGATVAVDSANLQESLSTQTAIESFRTAPNTSAKTTALQRAAAVLENRTSALFQRQQRSIRQFNDGRISTELLFRRLAETDARARAISSSAVEIQRTAENTGGYVIPFDLSSRFNNVEQRTTLLYTDLRGNIGASLAGTRDSRRYLVSASNNAFVVAGGTQGQFVRETYIDSQFQRGGSDRFNGDLGDAIEYVYDLYPWAEANQRPPYSDIDTVVGSLYQVTINHKHGRLLTYLDGSNGEIFFEIQENRLSTLPTTETATAENESADLSVRANLTYPTGPMELAVRNTAADTPADARISVDGQFVGRTGSDGRLWTVQSEATTQIEAVAGDDRVSFTVTNVAAGR
ncbi:DUF7096 domain-containing protein [Halorientalis pallida]|uniref:Uncharacterized protein n=1 Tax=Halorientalis pallida TaxID=2479928 RepID=A0A498KYT0_9EURY|nr:hypothetical protein [Halorientalis pallida]RXK50519.1 hypothetical protein EAF64_08205 [Halorientalis pallida]